MGAPDIPGSPKVPAVEVKGSPVALGARAPRAVRLSSTRVVNRSRRVGGSIRDPEPRPGTKEGKKEVKGRVQGEVRNDWERKEVEKVQREKRKKRGAEGRRNWTRGKRKMVWEGGGVGARPGVGSRVLSRGQQSLHQ